MTQPPQGSWQPPVVPPPQGWPNPPQPGQYPGQYSAYPSQGAPPPPAWGPPTTQPVSQRDPYAPIGAQPPASVSIDQFVTPRTRAPWIIAGVVLVLLIGLFWMGSNVDRFMASADSGVATRPVTPSAIPTSVASGNGVEFHSTRDDADGIFEIVDYRWTTRGLELDVLIEVSSGTFSYNFFALDNTTTEEFIPLTSAGPGYLSPGTVGAGNSVEGTVIFPKERGDTTVILADETSRQVTALSVQG